MPPRRVTDPALLEQAAWVLKAGFNISIAEARAMVLTADEVWVTGMTTVAALTLRDRHITGMASAVPGMGYGSELLEAVIAAHPSLSLDLDPQWKHYERLRMFYLKRGFVPVDDTDHWEHMDTDQLLARLVKTDAITFIRELGRGFWGAVFQARWQGMDVAVKIYYVDEEAAGREAELQRRAHAQVPRAAPALYAQDGLVLISELVDGITLGAFMDTGSRPGADLWLRIFETHLRFLANGIAHQDLHEDNIMLADRVVFIDWGATSPEDHLAATEPPEPETIAREFWLFVIHLLFNEYQYLVNYRDDLGGTDTPPYETVERVVMRQVEFVEGLRRLGTRRPDVPKSIEEITPYAEMALEVFRRHI